VPENTRKKKTSFPRLSTADSLY